MQIGPFGLPEILAILVLALIVFGPRKLPELARALGRAMGEFRKGSEEFKRTLDREVRELKDLEEETRSGVEETRRILETPEGAAAHPASPTSDEEPDTDPEAGP